MENSTTQTDKDAQKIPSAKKAEQLLTPQEIGGRKGPEPTRYGDWENKGKCVDF